MTAKDFRQIEQAHRKRLNLNLPVVVRFDGKNITKDHTNYHLLEENGFTHAITATAIQLVQAYRCAVYSYLDEVNIIFLEPPSFFLLTEDDDLLYSAVMILQDFKALLPSDLRDIKFNTSIFNIPSDQCFNYLLYRKRYCEESTLVYYAKEFFLPDFYHGKSKKQLREDLLAKGCPINSPELDWFFNGRMYIRRQEKYEQIKFHQ